jgi:hypothetical protein
MDKRDWELLDKQLYGVSPIPPARYGAIIVLTAVAGFLIGMTLGDVVAVHQNNPTLIASYEAGAGR